MDTLRSALVAACVLVAGTLSAQTTVTITETPTTVTVSGETVTVTTSGDDAATVVTAGTQGPAGPDGPYTAVLVVDGTSYSSDGFGIQDAIDDLPVAGGQVYIPSGTYSIKGTIALRDNVRLTGAGTSSVLQHVAETTYTLAATAANAQADITVTDVTGLQVGMSLTLYDDLGDEGDNSPSRKITNISGTTVTLSSNLTREFNISNNPKAGNVFPVISADGAHYGAADISYVEIDHLLIDGNKANVGARSSLDQHGIVFYDVQSFWIHEVTVQNAEYDGFTNGGVDKDVWGRVTDSTFKDNGQNGIHPGATYRQAIISGNVITGNTVWGMFFCESTQHVTFSNNLVADNGQHGVTAGWNNWDNVIANNVIVRNGWAGIYSQHDGTGSGGTTHFTVVGNVIMDNGTAVPTNSYPGIGLYNSTYWTIIGNVIRDTQTPKTQRYGIASYGTADYNMIVGNSVIGSGFTADTSLVGAHDVVLNDGAAYAQLAGPLRMTADGAVDAPAYSFSSETNSGWYRSAANVWDFSIAGTRRLQLSANLIQFGGIWYLADATGANAFSLTRAAAGQVTWNATTFAALGASANGTFAYCSDCAVANPCAGSGTGALAKRLNGAWVCN